MNTDLQPCLRDCGKTFRCGSVSFSSNRRPLRPPILAPWQRPTMLLQLERLRTAGSQLSSSHPRTTGSQPSSSRRPRIAGSRPNNSRPRTAGSQFSSFLPRTAGSQSNSSRPKTAGSRPNNSHRRHNQNQKRWWPRNPGSRSRQLKLLGRRHSPGVCTQVFSLTVASDLDPSLSDPPGFGSGSAFGKMRILHFLTA